MNAVTRIGFEQVEGRTQLSQLLCEPPLTFRPTPQGLRLVGTAAGPAGGDKLKLVIEVGDGAHADIRSVASSVALPGPVVDASTLDIEVNVGEDASLVWSPESTILVSGCYQLVRTTICLAATARLWWREEFVFGRHQEGSGSVFNRTRIERGDKLFLASDFKAGPAWPGSQGPVGTAGAKAAGSVTIVGQPANEVQGLDIDGVRTAVMPRTADACVVSAITDHAGRLPLFFDSLIPVRTPIHA